MKNKNTFKILDKAIELAKLLIELQKSKQVPIPDYKKICKSVKIICDDSIDKNEYFVCDGKNTPLSNFQKLWDETKLDFLKEIIKKEKESDFHKGMIDAEKELQRVCSNKLITPEYLMSIGFKSSPLYWFIKDGISVFISSEFHHTRICFNNKTLVFDIKYKDELDDILKCLNILQKHLK